MSPGPEIQEVARRLIGIFDALKAPYAVGGAVAMAFAGYVRATLDVDVLALVPALRFQDLADHLAAEGFEMRGRDERPIPPAAALMSASARELGHFRIWRGDTRAEVFLPKVPLQDSVLRRRVLADLGDFKMWITTAEDLILLKMIFHRPKDLEDVRRMLAANRQTLDVSYLKDWSSKTLAAPVARELQDLMAGAGIAA